MATFHTVVQASSSDDALLVRTKNEKRRAASTLSAVEAGPSRANRPGNPGALDYCSRAERGRPELHTLPPDRDNVLLDIMLARANAESCPGRYRAYPVSSAKRRTCWALPKNYPACSESQYTSWVRIDSIPPSLSSLLWRRSGVGVVPLDSRFVGDRQMASARERVIREREQDSMA
jgi:hypothetical protein